MATVKGVIEATGRDGRGLKIGDSWYGAFKLEQVGAATRGSEVEIDYEVTDRGYNNIKGNVRIVAPEAKGPVATRKGASASLPDIERQMMIIRQNALTNAVNFTAAKGSEVPASIADVISVAQRFELYTSGKLGSGTPGA